MCRQRHRHDWYEEIPDKEYQARFRFSKENFRRIVDLLRPQLERETDHGSPLTPDQIVLNASGSRKYG